MKLEQSVSHTHPQVSFNYSNVFSEDHASELVNVSFTFGDITISFATGGISAAYPKGSADPMFPEHVIVEVAVFNSFGDLVTDRFFLDTMQEEVMDPDCVTIPASQIISMIHRAKIWSDFAS